MVELYATIAAAGMRGGNFGTFANCEMACMFAYQQDVGQMK